jgi:hypothetical protein
MLTGQGFFDLVEYKIHELIIALECANHCS